MKVDKVVVVFIILTVLEIIGLIYTKFFVTNVNTEKSTGILIIAVIIGFIFGLSRAIYMIYKTFKLVKTGEPSLDYVVLCSAVIISSIIRAL